VRSKSVQVAGCLGAGYGPMGDAYPGAQGYPTAATYTSAVPGEAPAGLTGSRGRTGAPFKAGEDSFPFLMIWHHPILGLIFKFNFIFNFVNFNLNQSPETRFLKITPTSRRFKASISQFSGKYFSKDCKKTPPHGRNKAGTIIESFL